MLADLKWSKLPRKMDRIGLVCHRLVGYTEHVQLEREARMYRVYNPAVNTVTIQ